MMRSSSNDDLPEVLQVLSDALREEKMTALEADHVRARLMATAAPNGIRSRALWRELGAIVHAQPVWTTALVLTLVAHVLVSLGAYTPRSSIGPQLAELAEAEDPDLRWLPAIDRAVVQEADIRFDVDLRGGDLR